MHLFICHRLIEPILPGLKSGNQNISGILFFFFLWMVSSNINPFLSMASPVDDLQACLTVDKNLEVKTLKTYLHKFSFKQQSCFPEADLVVGLYDLAHSLISTEQFSFSGQVSVSPLTCC